MLYIFSIISLSLLQSSCYKLYGYFRNFSYTSITQNPSLKRNEKITLENCGTQTRIIFFWQHTRRCSTGKFHFTQRPNFSTTSQTYLCLLLQFSQMTVETWLHLSLTTVKWFWTIDHSWGLVIIPLQVTSYKASFMQFSPELFTNQSS